LRTPTQLTYVPMRAELAAMPEFSQLNASPGLSLMQYVVILRAYWRQSLIIATSIVVIATAVLTLMPKTYAAVATLIVNSDNKDALAGQQFSGSIVLANYILTQTELMLNRVTLWPVIDRLKLTEDREFASGFSGGDSNSLREYVEKNLRKNVQVNQGRGGQLLYVTASARNSVRAADIANAIADVYLEHERRGVSDPTGERASRYSQELAELRAKATAAQDRVTEFRQQNDITDIAATNVETDTESQALANLEQRLLEARNLRRSLEAKEAGDQTSSDEALASNVILELKTDISTQEAQLAQLSATLGAQHPKVRELRLRIDATRQLQKNAMHTLTQNVTTQLARAKELEDKMAVDLTAQRAKVLHLRVLQDEGAKLLLDLDAAQAVYKRAVDGYDQIEFASVGNYTNVSFISRATPPVKPSKPNKLMLLVVAVFTGVLVGLVGPLAYELLFNRRLRCRDDIERAFGIPVLAQFEPIRPTPSSA
jgi:succinoglycan biosynthesis transport protein ExoP